MPLPNQPALMYDNDVSVDHPVYTPNADMTLSQTGGAFPADGDVLTYHAASGKWINQAPAGGGGGVAVTVGTRASLPGSGTNVGDTYICSDTDYTYIWSGSVWNAFHHGGYVNDPSIDSTFVRKTTTTVTGDSIVTSFGGARIKDGAVGSGDHILSYVKPVTPSSTLKVRIGFKYSMPSGPFRQGGPVVYNSNTGKWLFFRYASSVLFYSRYNDSTGLNTNVTSVGPPSITNTGMGASPAANPYPVQFWCFDFDGSNWYLRLYQDGACQSLISTVFSEALSSWIGTNFTHIGIGMNPASGDAIQLEDLTVLHA
jgi:hypothetical protein